MIDQIRRGGNTLILIDRVGAGQALVSRIQDAVFLSGATKNSERQEEYDEVATATDKVLVCTYGIAAVGINVPRIFNLVLIEPGKSFVRVIQSIGRGIRRASDKDHVEIWDITSSCKFAKRHLTQRKNFYREAKYPFDLERVNYI
jgi:superfamily II DNA or RNA helicase